MAIFGLNGLNKIGLTGVNSAKFNSGNRGLPLEALNTSTVSGRLVSNAMKHTQKNGEANDSQQAVAGTMNARIRGVFTGYAYDLVRTCDDIARIQTLAGVDIRAYAKEDVASSTPLVNVSVPQWELVLIGFNGKTAGLPVLARNRNTGEFVVARNLVWYEEKGGFVWDSGSYFEALKDARKVFDSYAGDNILYIREDIQ